MLETMAGIAPEAGPTTLHLSLTEATGHFWRRRRTLLATPPDTSGDAAGHHPTRDALSESASHRTTPQPRTSLAVAALAGIG